MSDSVPELSLHDFTAGDASARAAFAQALFAGLTRFGFVILRDHNVAPDLLARAYALAGDLFARPEAEKRRHAAGLRGYTPFRTEHAKDSAVADLKEFWQIGRERDGASAAQMPAADFPPNVWPPDDWQGGLPSFRETFLALYAALDETGRLLLQALAPRLGYPPDHFDPLVRHGTSILRVLHYPPVPDDAEPGAVRSAAHEDINFLTIMVAARGAGLELLDRSGAWRSVAADPSRLIVNSGDMLQRLTGGVIPSTTHRVVNPAGPNVSRYSMPFFMHPASDTPLGGGLTAGEFLRERLAAIGLA